jgi:hypothetical protein
VAPECKVERAIYVAYVLCTVLRCSIKRRLSALNSMRWVLPAGWLCVLHVGSVGKGWFRVTPSAINNPVLLGPSNTVRRQQPCRS